MGTTTESESLFLKKSGNLLVIILLAVPVLVGVILLIASAKNILSIDVKEIKEYSYDSLEDGEVYYFDELIIIDRYATTKNERVSKKTGQTVSVDYDDAYIAGFVDKDGQWVYVDLSMGRYTDLGWRCDDYAEDDTRKLGDLVISGCFKGYDLEKKEPSGYFGIAYELCNAELPGEVLVWDFYYQDAETIEDYREDKVGDATSSIMFGLVMMIPCTIGILIFVGKRKNLMPDGYVERLRKYAVRYLPENMNDLHTQRAMLDTVRRVLPIEDKMIPALQKVFESGSFGELSAMQFQGQIAASVERWCATFKEKEILAKVKNMEPEQVLPVWIIMDFYCAILEEERRYNLKNYCQRIAKAIYKKGFVIPEPQNTMEAE